MRIVGEGLVLRPPGEADHAGWLDLYADPSTVANEKIAFNAGSLTNSIVMATADWVRIAKPEVFEFAEKE